MRLQHGVEYPPLPADTSEGFLAFCREVHELLAAESTFTFDEIGRWLAAAMLREDT